MQQHRVCLCGALAAIAVVRLWCCWTVHQLASSSNLNINGSCRRLTALHTRGAPDCWCRLATWLTYELLCPAFYLFAVLLNIVDAVYIW